VVEGSAQLADFVLAGDASSLLEVAGPDGAQGF